MGRVIIDEQVAAAHKRLRERTNRRAGQVLRHLRYRLFIDQIEFSRQVTLAFRPWISKRDADKIYRIFINRKITDPLE